MQILKTNKNTKFGIFIACVYVNVLAFLYLILNKSII